MKAVIPEGLPSGVLSAPLVACSSRSLFLLWRRPMIFSRAPRRLYLGRHRDRAVSVHETAYDKKRSKPTQLRIHPYSGSSFAQEDAVGTPGTGSPCFSSLPPVRPWDVPQSTISSQRTSRTRFGPSSKIVNRLSTSLPSRAYGSSWLASTLTVTGSNSLICSSTRNVRQRQQVASESESRNGVERHELKLLDEPPGDNRQIGSRIDLGGHFDPGRALVGGTHRHVHEGCRGSHLLVVHVPNHHSPLPGSRRGEGRRTRHDGSSVTSPT